MKMRALPWVAGLAIVCAAAACNESKLIAPGGGGDGSPTAAPSATPSVEANPAGCADGTREGFLSTSQYPTIAACAGAWSVPGVSQDNLAPACGRQAGNQSVNPEGSGCSAADLCAVGWHICHGFAEVGQRAPSGCADAVPSSAAPGVFFAIAQHSHDHMVCDDSSTDVNDVFGCGSLGVTVSSTQNCGPLDVALASEQPNTCGWNQAMPPIGPWQCAGSNSYDEGAFVTKNGCPGGSCSYSGTQVGNSDDGGVLCCAD